jgi:predicted enzyme related to lactoylglutathione lyase
VRAIVNIDVPDLDRAIAFYRDAVGLRLARIIDDDVAELEGASCALYLLQKPEGAGAAGDSGDERRYGRHWTPVHVDFVVDDVEAAAARALSAGAVRESDCIEWRGSKCITFSDPFGHGFCLIEFEAGSYTGDAPRR